MTDQRKPTELGSKEFWDRLASDPKALAVEVCTIDLVDLDRTLYQHPGLRAWINVAFENAQTEKERAEWKVTKARAAAFLKAKEVPDPQTNKQKNADTCKAEAEQSPELEAAMQELFVAQDKLGALKAMAKALEDRKDMLVQISANRRKERDES